jgi:hypothetical protein
MTTAHAFDREEVMAYLDGQIADEPRTVAVRAHIDACEECRGLMASIQGVAARLREWGVEPAPERLRPPVTPWVEPRADVESEPPRRHGLMAWLRWPRWAIGLAAAGLLAIVGAETLRMLLMSDNDKTPGAYAPGDHDVRARSMEFAYPAPPMPPTEPPGRPGQTQGQASAVQGESIVAGPMIIRVATIGITTDRFEAMRGEVERLTAAHEGRIASLAVTGESNQRALAVTLRVPSARLDALMGSLRALGKVRNESVGTEDVTEAQMDLGIRVTNAKREEQRLLALLSDRTGKLSDVLAVEEALSRVRTDIERMEASLRSTKSRVDLSTINLRIDENYRAEVALGPLPIGARFRNAVVDGGSAAAASLVSAALGLLEVLPTLAVWALILAWPVRWVVRRARVGMRA